MSQWYFARSGQREGPVDRMTLESLARSGELKPDDLIWTEGMGEWQQARTVDGLFAPPKPEPGTDPANPYASPTSAITVPQAPPSSGTLEVIDPPARLTVGGPLDLAMKILKKDFGMILAAGLVYLGVIIGISLLLEFVGWAIAFAGGSAPDWSNQKSVEEFLNRDQPLAWVITSNMLAQLLGTFMALGLTRVALDVVVGKRVRIGALFSQVAKLPGAFAGSILLGLMIAGPALLVAGLILLSGGGEPTPATLAIAISFGALLVCFPGAYFAARFGFFQTAMVDREMSMPEAFRESSRLTDGNKWMVVGLYAVLTLINLAGILLFCVGLVFALPLTTVAWVVAYKWMVHGPDALAARIHRG